MGGIVCAIHRYAILRYESIPTGKKELKEFDLELRDCFRSSDVAKAIEEAGKGMQVCELLKKEDWTSTEREELFDALEDLYEY